jgi:ATP-dependent Lon protease
MDTLDKLANDVFAGRVVRKDLVRQVKVGANVPVYVLEFLLGKYAASDDPAAIEAGLEVVHQTLRENFIRPDEAELLKARVKQRGQVRLIDKVDVRLVASEDKFWAHLQSFNDKYVHIGEDLVYRYDRLLQGGAWCQLDLIYDAADDEDKKRPFYIKALKPIQVAAFDRDAYVDGRRNFSRDSWRDLVMRTIGLEPSEYTDRGKLLALTRLIPMTERNYNLIELGPWGTGKSFVYRESNPNAILISGGKVTVAQLFINMSTGRVGLLGTWDTVTFDEVAGLQMSDTTVVNMLKDYMESGSFARGKEEVPAEASVVLIGNTSKPHTDLVRTAHLFADLPAAMIDPAFLDRINFYLPGWETPKLESRLFTNHFGFARDEKSVRKTVSGLLKILHPHGEWTRVELREYLEFALEGRRRVKEQLKKLAAHDYAKTAFSYVERDTGHEYWVEVPEQPESTEDALEAVPQAEAAVDTDSATQVSVQSLIERGEGSHVEFKMTGRMNSHTGQRDPVLEHMVVKSVAGFLNAAGGTLLIGVRDDGEVTGIEADFPTLGRKATLDGYSLWLSGLLDNRMGPAAVANLSIGFEGLPGGTVCRVDLKPAASPIFVSGGRGEAELFVRLNNATRGLNVAEALEYVRTHWG